MHTLCLFRRAVHNRERMLSPVLSLVFFLVEAGKLEAGL